MGLSNIPVNRIVRKPPDQAPPDTRKSGSTFGASLLTFIPENIYQSGTLLAD